ncbi:MAG TPA: hypothetical protein V6C65_33360 [Allocoleopsis sp.]
MENAEAQVEQPIRRIPGLLKMGGIAAGGLLALMVVGVILKQAGSMMNTQPQQIGDAIALPKFAQQIQAPAQPVSTPEASPTPQASQQKLWDAIGAENQRLAQAISATDSKLTQARAQRWWMHAINQCNQEGLSQCPSPYTWLLRAYQAQAAIVQQLILEGKIPVDADTSGRYRHEVQQLQDIANALAIPVGGSAPEPFVQTVDLSSAIEQLYTQASQYEAFRQTQPTSEIQGIMP